MCVQCNLLTLIKQRKDRLKVAQIVQIKDNTDFRHKPEHLLWLLFLFFFWRVPVFSERMMENPSVGSCIGFACQWTNTHL